MTGQGDDRQGKRTRKCGPRGVREEGKGQWRERRDREGAWRPGQRKAGGEREDLRKKEGVDMLWRGRRVHGRLERSRQSRTAEERGGKGKGEGGRTGEETCSGRLVEANDGGVGVDDLPIASRQQRRGASHHGAAAEVHPCREVVGWQRLGEGASGVPGKLMGADGGQRGGRRGGEWCQSFCPCKQREEGEKGMAESGGTSSHARERLEGRRADFQSLRQGGGRASEGMGGGT